MDLENIHELVGFIQEQEHSEQEESLLEKLERQKRLLLKKQEVEDFRKFVEATKTYCEQQKLTYRHQLERANATKKLCHKIDQMKIEVQRVIDRTIEQTLSSAQEQSRRFHLKEEHREKKRRQIDELRGQLERYEDIAKHIRESKGQAMLRAAKATAEDETRKLDSVRNERDKMKRTQREKEAGEWEESKAALVEIGRLWAQVRAQERENKAIDAKNGLVRAEIVKTAEELEQQRIIEEEEAKRLEEESSQRALTPIKISHTDMGLFKNPNDFPVMTTKIEASRRSYENIFKRPEYMELKKFKCDKRVKLRKHTQVAPEGVKNQLAVVVPRLKADETQSKGVVAATVSDIGTQSTKMVVDQPPKKSASMVEEPVTQPKTSSSKKLVKPSKQVATPAVRRQKLKPEKLDFTEAPTPKKEVEITEKSTPTAKKRTSSNVLELTKENIDSMLSSAKRPKKQQSPIAAEPPKPKKVTIDPKPVQIPLEQEPFSPPAPPSPPSPVSEAAAAQPERGTEQDADSNSGGSSPPRRHPEAFDGVSLGGSISSLELNDHDSVSDLGFDLSPVGSFDESGAGGGGEDNKRGGSSSPGAGMDFDFLNEDVPAKVASQRGSQSKKKAAAAPAKASDGLDFLGGSGGDESGGFDFF
uniref:Putative calponin similarity domain-containing protein ddb g0272472 isoform x1 n=1 Tax=Culex tarsalis TaxID=7177 RepID=A0A1Q3FW73_CULTA